MSMCSLLLCCWKRVFAMTSVFSWQNSVSLCPASFCTPRPNLPVTPGISWLPTFAFQLPIMKRTSFGGVSSRRSCRSSSDQIRSVAQSCPTLCDPMNHSTPGFPVHHQLPEFTQTHVHRVNDAIQPSHPLLPASPPAFNLSQWVGSSYRVAKVLEFQLQNQSFQWTFRLISFRVDWFDHLAVQGTLKSHI